MVAPSSKQPFLNMKTPVLLMHVPANGNKVHNSHKVGGNNSMFPIYHMQSCTCFRALLKKVYGFQFLYSTTIFITWEFVYFVTICLLFWDKFGHGVFSGDNLHVHMFTAPPPPLPPLPSFTLDVLSHLITAATHIIHPQVMQNTL